MEIRGHSKDTINRHISTAGVPEKYQRQEFYHNRSSHLVLSMVLPGPLVSFELRWIVVHFVRCATC